MEGEQVGNNVETLNRTLSFRLIERGIRIHTVTWGHVLHVVSCVSKEKI